MQFENTCQVHPATATTERGTSRPAARSHTRQPRENQEPTFLSKPLRAGTSRAPVVPRYTLRHCEEAGVEKVRNLGRSCCLHWDYGSKIFPEEHRRCMTCSPLR